MPSEEYDFRQIVARLSTSQFRNYLVARGWVEKPSRYVDHMHFEVTLGDPSICYELYLPVSADVPKYHTRVMRSIYKLCGIEEREPIQIARDLLACDVSCGPKGRVGDGVIRVRLTNSRSTPIKIHVNAPRREHDLMPGEAVELMCKMSIEHGIEIALNDRMLTILTSNQN